MRREIVINAGSNETRIALLEDKELVEVMVERPEAVRRVGDIYKGRVNAVLPGMQAAFVDLGLEKSAFLHASDLQPSDSDYDDLFEEEEETEERKKGGGRGRREETAPRIEEARRKGQDHVGVSRKIEDRAERARLKGLIKEIRPKNAGVIVRTVGAEQGKKEFQSDIKYLEQLWEKIEKQ